MCCATKRLVEISCTEDCRYLESAQRHPAAVIKRQIDADVTVLMSTIGRLSEQQLQLFFLLQSTVLSYKPEGLARLTDPDVALAAGALAGSLETASKGLIFEESTGSDRGGRASARVEIGHRRGDQEAADRAWNARWRSSCAVSSAVRSTRAGIFPQGETSYLELVGRVFQQRPKAAGPSRPLIVMP